MSRHAVSWRRWAWHSPVSQRGALWNRGRQDKRQHLGLFLSPLPHTPSRGGTRPLFLGHLTYLEGAVAPALHTNIPSLQISLPTLLSH